MKQKWTQLFYLLYMASMIMATVSLFQLDVSPVLASGLNIGGWVIEQYNASHSYTIPVGTTIPENGWVVIGRAATQAQFEAFWGVSLGSNVVYLNSDGQLPQINGDEYFELYDGSSTLIDGPTVQMSSSAGLSYRRNNPGDPSNQPSSWTSGTANTTATPGSGTGTRSTAGVVIYEFSDATGVGNYIYEFVELYYDTGPTAVTLFSFEAKSVQRTHVIWSIVVLVVDMLTVGAGIVALRRQRVA